MKLGHTHALIFLAGCAALLSVGAVGCGSNQSSEAASVSSASTTDDEDDDDSLGDELLSQVRDPLSTVTDGDLTLKPYVDQAGNIIKGSDGKPMWIASSSTLPLQSLTHSQ